MLRLPVQEGAGLESITVQNLEPSVLPLPSKEPRSRARPAASAAGHPRPISALAGSVTAFGSAPWTAIKSFGEGGAPEHRARPCAPGTCALQVRFFACCSQHPSHCPRGHPLSPLYGATRPICRLFPLTFFSPFLRRSRCSLRRWAAGPQVSSSAAPLSRKPTLLWPSRQDSSLFLAG